MCNTTSFDNLSVYDELAYLFPTFKTLFILLDVRLKIANLLCFASYAPYLPFTQSSYQSIVSDYCYRFMSRHSFRAPASILSPLSITGYALSYLLFQSFDDYLLLPLTHLIGPFLISDLFVFLAWLVRNSYGFFMIGIPFSFCIIWCAFHVFMLIALVLSALQPSYH